MKHIVKTAAILCMTLFAAAGCNNPVDLAEENQAGKTVIRIGGAEGQTRTVSPASAALEDFTYELGFKGPDVASHKAEAISYGGAKMVSLAPGEWTITAQGKDGDAVKAEGSWTGTVSSEESAEVFITLTPKTGSGSGSFTYTVEFPGITAVPGLGEGWSKSLDVYEVKPDGTETAVALETSVTDFTPGESYTISLPAGFYRVSLGLTYWTQNIAAITAAAHIYSGLDADAKFTITEEDFGVTKVLSSIAITAPPSKTEYALEEVLNINNLDLSGMVVTAYYEDGSSAEVSGFSVSDFDIRSATVTVSYTEGGITQTATFPITIPDIPGFPGL